MPDRKAARIRRGLSAIVRGDARAVLRDLSAAARKSGQPLYLVGGAVRDAWLGGSTCDLDLVIEGELRPLLAAAATRWVRRSQFETASVITADGARIDVAAARRETYAHPAALPTVAPAGLAEDLRRRDFTVNTLAVPVRARGFGALIDPFGGVADLERRRLRVLHPRSFVDDPTRVLRGLRLGARLGMRFARESRAALELARRAGAFGRLSAARLRREVELALDCTEAPRIVRAWVEHGVFEEILPGLRPPDRATAAALRRVAAQPLGRRWIVGLGVLLHGGRARTSERVIARLALDRRAAQALRTATGHLARLQRQMSRRRLRPSDLHRLGQDLPPEVLHMVAALSPDARVRRRARRILEIGPSAAPDIDGHDLLAAGVPRGPAIARGLAAALAAKLDGKAPTPQAQLRWALAAARRA